MWLQVERCLFIVNLFSVAIFFEWVIISAYRNFIASKIVRG
jgi:hypothetical protein